MDNSIQGFWEGVFGERNSLRVQKKSKRKFGIENNNCNFCNTILIITGASRQISAQLRQVRKEAAVSMRFGWLVSLFLFKEFSWQ